MSLQNLLYLTEDQVKKYLNWETLVPEIENVLADAVEKNENSLIQPARTIMPIPQKNGVFLTMPGMSLRRDALGCKLVTSFVNNAQKYGLPSIMATIVLFDSDTGKVKAILEGTAITEWRTAAASVVATKYLYFSIHEKRNKILAVFGAGKQARIHIIAFQHCFGFKEIRVWNRNYENALKLAEDLKTNYNIDVKCFQEAALCVSDADVIITATYSSEPFLNLKDLTKTDIVINAVGAGINHHSELGMDIYREAQIFTDTMESAKIELKGLIDQGIIVEELGKVIHGVKNFERKNIKIFHSLGMAVEDSVSAKLVYTAYMNEEYKSVV